MYIRFMADCLWILAERAMYPIILYQQKYIALQLKMFLVTYPVKIFLVIAQLLYKQFIHKTT